MAEQADVGGGIAEALGHDPRGQPLDDVGPKDFDDFYDRLRSRGLSPATIQRYHALLGGAFLVFAGGLAAIRRRLVRR